MPKLFKPLNHATKDASNTKKFIGYLRSSRKSKCFLKLVENNQAFTYIALAYLLSKSLACVVLPIMLISKDAHFRWVKFNVWNTR